MQAQDNPSTPQKSGGFAAYFLKRFIVAILVIGVVLWALATVVDHFEKPGSVADRWNEAENSVPQPQHSVTVVSPHKDSEQATVSATHGSGTDQESATADKSSLQNAKDILAQLEGQHKAEQPLPATAETHAAETEVEIAPPPPAKEKAQEHQTPAATHGTAPVSTEKLPVGVAFVTAVIQPISYELEDRFWGWRPNDIINLTDNINEFQLGTLEVTRRTVVQLTERISRTGYNDVIDRNLENAMNFLMVKADSYWFPSPESKYKESIAELEKYKQKLMAGKANFYTRPDNLIPLFTAYEDLLGSCDENLVKSREKDGSKVGFATADNYFYYSKGVANAMVTILEAVQRDFATTLELRHGEELLHHAIIACSLAASLEPWIVTNGSLDGILANHRAHMAAPISHARYYMGQLIKTLST